MSDVNDELAALIQQFEGFGTAAAPSITSGNNPGAIMYSPYAIAHGSTGISPNGTAIFPSYQSGMDALKALLSSKEAAGYTTPSSLIGSYEGDPFASLASTENYISHVASGLGIGVNDTIPGLGSSGTQSTPAGPGAAGIDLGKIIPGYGAGKALVSGVSWFTDISRVTTLVIGAALLIGGVLMLRPIQQVVTETVGRGKKLAGMLA